MTRTDTHHLPGRKMARPVVLVALLLVSTLVVVLYSRVDALAAEVRAQNAAPLTVSYSYDAAGRLVQEDYGGGKTIIYTYDAAGNLLHSGPELAGDVDADCDVDIVDIMLVASRWGSSRGDDRYDAWYDLDSDGDIDIVDIMMVASRWNQHCS